MVFRQTQGWVVQEATASEGSADMTDYLLIAAGVVIGVVFPVIRGFVVQEFPPTGAPGLPPMG